MKILSLDSLEKIENFLDDNPEDTVLVDDFSYAVELLGLRFIDSEYELPIDNVNLIASERDENLLKNEQNNCQSIYSAFSSLTPADATDERLWSTLCFMQLSSYVKKRWPLPKSSKARYIKNHYLIKNNRNMLRDNAISRLWWLGRLANICKGVEPRAAYDILLVNSDLRNNLLERTGTSSYENVLEVMIKIMKKGFDKGVEWNRSSSREFLKSINFVFGKSNLAVLDQESIGNILQPLFDKAFKSKEKRLWPFKQ